MLRTAELHTKASHLLEKTCKQIETYRERLRELTAGSHASLTSVDGYVEELRLLEAQREHMMQFVVMLRDAAALVVTKDASEETARELVLNWGLNLALLDAHHDKAKSRAIRVVLSLIMEARS